ncbi:MAG: uroporphyrinogen decarboxylase family protein [Spirochaetales bacterium]|nr:uroporphyrinogen decarboxylase family protein [Spirochaetales bacterium]
MTAKERFGSLLTGQLPDRVPVICNLFEQGAREMGLSIKEYYSRGEYVAEGQLKLAEKYGHDNLWAFHHTAGDAEMLGSRFTAFADDGPPNVGDLILRSESDIYNLKITEDILDTKAHREVSRTLEILKEEKGDEYPVLGAVVASYSMPAILIGMEKWMELLYLSSDRAAVTLLEKCSEFCRIKTKALFDEGADMVVYMNPLASAEFITVDRFRNDALKWIKKDTEATGSGGMVYFNGGGPINPMIEPLMEATDFPVIYINPHDDVAEAKSIIAGKRILVGTFNDIRLISQSEKEIQEDVDRIVEAGKPGGGFAFGTLVMPLAIREENIRLMIDRVKEKGRY